MTAGSDNELRMHAGLAERQRQIEEWRRGLIESGLATPNIQLVELVRSHDVTRMTPALEELWENIDLRIVEDTTQQPPRRRFLRRSSTREAWLKKRHETIIRAATFVQDGYIQPEINQLKSYEAYIQGLSQDGIKLLNTVEPDVFARVALTCWLEDQQISENISRIHQSAKEGVISDWEYPIYSFSIPIRDIPMSFQHTDGGIVSVYTFNRKPWIVSFNRTARVTNGSSIEMLTSFRMHPFSRIGSPEEEQHLDAIFYLQRNVGAIATIQEHLDQSLTTVYDAILIVNDYNPAQLKQPQTPDWPIELTPMTIFKRKRE